MVRDFKETMWRRTNRTRMRLGLPEILTDGEGNLANVRKNGRITKLRKGEKYIE